MVIVLDSLSSTLPIRFNVPGPLTTVAGGFFCFFVSIPWESKYPPELCLTSGVLSSNISGLTSCGGLLVFLGGNDDKLN